MAESLGSTNYMWRTKFWMEGVQEGWGTVVVGFSSKAQQGQASIFHRIIECFGFGGTFRIISFDNLSLDKTHWWNQSCSGSFSSHYCPHVFLIFWSSERNIVWADTTWKVVSFPELWKYVMIWKVLQFTWRRTVLGNDLPWCLVSTDPHWMRHSNALIL